MEAAPLPLDAAKLASRVYEMLRHVGDARRSERERCVRLLSDLTPRLQAAGTAEQRDRRQAPRFNVLNYLRKDELGLSRMIADLLDPTAEHGQGPKFLEAMLDALPETRGRFGTLQPTAARPVSVRTERPTGHGGYMDITVDIPSAAGRFCLAFENKPYAPDLPGQCSGYLESLKAKYGTRFLLVYLPPGPREPDAASLPPADREHWRGHFAVMPYAGGDTSLKDWFAACRERCDAERVNWLLRDAESLCLQLYLQRFGESPMTIDAETRSVREYLTENPSHVRAAFAVHRAWPLLSSEVCERFLKHLRDMVERRLREELSDMGDDVRVACHYGGENRFANKLWITRDGWVRYDDTPTARRRCAIMLENQGKQGGPNGWLWGVRSPKGISNMSESERQRREELDAALERHGLSLPRVSEWWPQWNWLARYRDWDPLVPDLHDECEAGRGPITDCYVNGLLEIARSAIPAIDEVEAAERSTPGE